MSDTEMEKEKWKIQAKLFKDEMKDVKYEPFDHRTGPVASNLDCALAKHNIIPQSYHSRSFIGNHCHKYLRDDVYKDVTSSIITQTQLSTICQDTIDKAWLIKFQFDDLNFSLSQVHKKISHSKPLTAANIDDIENDIKKYMTIYRQQFPNKTLPKHHILEHHCVPFIKLTHFGLGLLGEQGVEASHQSLSKFERRASGIKSEVQRIKFVLETNLLQVAPSLRLMN